MTAGPGVLALEKVHKVRLDDERRFELEVPAFLVRQGDRIALLGRSGSGKSTMIEVLAAALRPEAFGSFMIQHPEEEAPRDIAAAWEADDDDYLSATRARCFGYVQQVGGLLGFLTARQNIALSLAILGDKESSAVEELAETLGLERHLEAYPAALSVGERQRVAIARALVHRPALVLADEPTGALDLGTAQQVMGQLTETADAWGSTLVIATHDRQLAEDFGFRLIEAEIAIEERSQWTRFTCLDG